MAKFKQVEGDNSVFNPQYKFPVKGKQKLLKGHKYFFKRGKKARIINCKNNGKDVHWRLGDILIDLTLMGLDQTVKTMADADKVFPAAYMPYKKLDKVEFPIVLHSKGDVRDTVEFKDGQWQVIKRVGVVPLSEETVKYINRNKRPK